MKRLWSFILFGLMALSAAPALAADGLNLQTSPLPVSLATTPGKSVSADLRVRNAGNNLEKLKINLLKFSVDNDGVVHLDARGPGDDYFDWVHFDKTTFDALPGEWQTIHLTIAVPQSAAFGYYYAVQFARAQENVPAPGQAAVHGSVVTFVLLDAQVPGAKREAKITRFSSDHSFYEFLPANFTVKVANSGNLHLAPHGDIFLSRGGKPAGQLSLNATLGNVLPNSTRSFATSWNDGWPVYVSLTDADGNPVKDAKGNPRQQLVWDFSKVQKLRFGHYTAKLVMVYNNGTGDVPLEASLSFWVVPWRLLGGLLMVVILAVVGLRSTLLGLWRKTFGLKA